MSSNFPTSLDNLDPTRGTNNDPLSSPNHVDHHANEDDAIEALQAKVGVNNSAVTSSLDYKVSSTSSSNPGHKHTLANGATDVTATATELNYVDGVTSAIQTQIDGANTNANTRQLRSVLTTKGDIYVATASDTVTRLGVGLDGTTLKANSSTGTGLEWADVATTDIQTFNSDGTWNKPSGALRVHVQVWGAGGSGARGGSGLGSGGGGGGAFNEFWFNASALASSESVTVGAGGTSRTGSAQNGADGGLSSFGSWISVAGGGGGVQGANGTSRDGGGGGEPYSNIPIGGTLLIGFKGLGDDDAKKSGIYSGAGGRWVTGDASKTGGNSYYGGAGGGAMEFSASTARAGGTSVFGGEGGASDTTTGVAGTAPGGGGGASNSTSGAGANGRVVVTTYF